ncbi:MULTISPECIES: hypothetical protein [Pseudomonas]|uniref:Uncharacterized protein n=1 Tax=Pseudomonas putida TaxID=303 RepID=A0A6B7Q0X4_PSEPU|nr:MULTISPECIES: hypothetical protein [Pseudomonas]QFX76671.1 hypothetical protein [Pseudomonas putida]
MDVEQRDANRQAFLALLEKHKVKQGESAMLINAVTQRPCSVRAVRSWLNDPTKKSSRPCPSWAVKALEDGIVYMQKLMERRKQQLDAQSIAEEAHP